jgi:hypothetical protein
MPTTKPDLVCPVDGRFPIRLTPVMVSASDIPQSIQWQCTNDSTHVGIINAGGSAKKGVPTTGGPNTALAEAIENMANTIANGKISIPNPVFQNRSRSSLLDDGNIYIRCLPSPKIATIGPMDNWQGPFPNGFNTTPVGQGMSAALGLVTGVKPGSVGIIIRPIVGDMVCDLYQAWTDQINNYEFYEPSYDSVIKPLGLKGLNIDAELSLGVRGPYPNPFSEGKITTGIGMPFAVDPFFPISPPYGGVRIAAHYVPKGNDPSYANSHWIQVVGNNRRDILVHSFGDKAVTANADSLGLFWSMDNGDPNQTGDPNDPFYDTPHPLAGGAQSQATANGQFFVDIPTTSLYFQPSIHIFGLFLGCWLDSTFSPTPNPTTFLYNGTVQLVANISGKNGQGLVVYPNGRVWYPKTGVGPHPTAAALLAVWNAETDVDGSHILSYLNNFVHGPGYQYEPADTYPGGDEMITPIQISQQGYVYEYLEFPSILGKAAIFPAAQNKALPLISFPSVPKLVDVWTPR